MGFIDKITYFFKKKNKMTAVIIDEVGKEYRKKVKYSNNTFMISMNGEKHAYLVDHNHVVYSTKNNEPISYYFINNPQPLKMEHHRNELVDSKGLKNLLDSKVITDLFSEEQKNLMMILLILVVINMLITIVVILIQTDVIHAGAK